MAALDLREAVRHALEGEMRRDERVVLLGDGVGALGGLFGATEGLLDAFGPQRVIDLPLGETGIVGAAVGMALYGMRPVPEIQFADYVYPAVDQIVSEMAKYRYRSAGQYTCPVVLRMPYGGGIGGGHYHSQSPEALFAHTPGITVVAPSNAVDAVGLLRSALRGVDPVIFLEPKNLYAGARQEVPDEDFDVAVGEAARVRSGDDVTLVAYGAMVEVAMRAADTASARGVAIDLIDLRTLVPFDIGMLLESVARTGRLVLVQEAPRFCGYVAEIAAIVAEKAVFHLHAPVVRVAGFDTPFPFALEHDYLPDADRVLQAIQQVMNY